MELFLLRVEAEQDKNKWYGSVRVNGSATTVDVAAVTDDVFVG